MIETATQTKSYLYAIVSGRAVGEAYGPIGIDGGQVHAISDGTLAAVVSDVPSQRLRPERRHLAAHHAVQKQLMGRGAMLPMAFGILADGPDAVRRILGLNREPLLAQLRAVEGKVEMTLRVAWDVSSIFEYFVRTHPELRMQRDRLFGGGREPSEDDKIELGRLFDRLLGEDRAADTRKILESLAPRCADLRECPLRNERNVANLACLVARDGLPQFEQGVFEAAKQFDDSYAFDYSGPWPPFNFAEVALKV